MIEERLTLSIEEASAQLGISTGLGYKLAKTGELPGVIRLGKKRLVVSRFLFLKFLEGRNSQEEAEPCL